MIYIISDVLSDNLINQLKSARLSYFHYSLISAGSIINDSIKNKISNCSIILYIINCNTNANDRCFEELEIAKKLNKRIYYYYESACIYDSLINTSNKNEILMNNVCKKDEETLSQIVLRLKKELSNG